VALDFARELRSAAWHTEAVGTDAVAGLRLILEETLTRIKDEVFGGADQHPGDPAEEPAHNEHTPREEPATRADPSTHNKGHLSSESSAHEDDHAGGESHARGEGHPRGEGGGTASGSA